MKQNASSNKTQIIIVATLIGLGILALIALLVYAFGGNAPTFSVPASATRTQTVPTPPCIEPILTLGTTTFHVKTIPNSLNGFPLIPQDTPESAYLVEGTTINYVFGLSPTANNAALNTVLKAGDPMVINWGDCSIDGYVVSSIDMVQPNDPSIFEQSSGGITVYVQTGATNLVIHGAHPIIEPAQTAAAEPTSQFQIEVAFADQTPSDPQTVKIALTITNRGNQPITLNSTDISLTAENNQEAFPLVVEPALPQQIDPGNSLQIVVTFPKPPANSALLRILNLTLDYYF